MGSHAVFFATLGYDTVMSVTIKQVFELAKQLSPSDRCVVVDRLLESVDPEQLDSDGAAKIELHPAWEAEIARRVAAIENGTAVLVPWEEVDREVQGILDRAANRQVS
jgi:putative addiction module component (TIGR02574 family)